MLGVSPPADNPLSDLFGRDHACCVAALHASQPPPKAENVSFRQQPMGGKDPKPEKRDSVSRRKNHALSVVKAQTHIEKEITNFGSDLVQRPLVIAEDQKVVHVADVALPPQLFFDEMISRPSRRQSYSPGPCVPIRRDKDCHTQITQNPVLENQLFDPRLRRGSV